jgi:branched-chain amino acid transport system ATP-binding protein
MLEISNLVCRYGKVTALKGISLKVPAKQLVVLVGANGAGKSTTLRAISGLVPAASGKITFDGQDITGMSAGRILQLGIAHCPEGRRVFSQMSVLENLEMGAYLRSDAKGILSDIDHIFSLFPRLAERRKQVAGTLSGGEQQMLAIGRAMMSRPKLIMFDEPSLGLAPNIVEQTFSIIRGIRESGTTVLMVEQNAYAALDMCNYAYLLEAGTMALEGPGEKLINDPHVREAYLGAGLAHA